MKMFKSSPLPFMGQKRRFVRSFVDVLNGIEDVNVVVDLFGGSGLLSHVAKRVLPDARVVYNDYDGFADRLANVKRTNVLLGKIRVLLEKVPKDVRVPDEIKRRILDVVAAESGYVDYITIGSSLMFSGKWAWNYEQLEKNTMYNVAKQGDYDVEGYLDGLEVVKEDYKVLYNRFRDVPGVLFLIDPPYLSTEVGQYECYWKLGDYLDVLKVLDGSRYVYFTSAKSQILELCQWMRENPEIGDPFAGAEVRTQQNNVNMGAKFTDIMMVKR